MTLLQNFDQLTTGAAMLGFILGYVYERQRGREYNIQDLISRAFAAATVPTGFAFLAGAFDPALLPMIPDIGLYASAIGIGILLMAFNELEDILNWFLGNRQTPS